MDFDLLGYIRDRANEAGDTVQENIAGSLRMAGEGLSISREQIMDYLQDIPTKGAIPIPFTDTSPEARTAAAFVKSTLGTAGQPFRIMENPASNEFYQQTIDAAEYYPERNVVVFNENIPNQEVYDELGRNFSNKDFGQYYGEVNPETGGVTVNDEFGTNRIPAWHRKRAVTGRDKEGGELDLLSRAISAGSAVHRKLEDAGMTNPYPFGAPGSVQIGTYQPRQ